MDTQEKKKNKTRTKQKHNVTKMLSGNVHLEQLVPLEHVARAQVPHVAGRQPCLTRVLVQPRVAVDVAVGQQQQVVLDVALAVVGIGHVAGQLVELN